MSHPAFDRVDHRPWPVRGDRWTWRQSWCDLLFAHWPIPAALLRPLVPDALAIQEFDGTSWIGVVPFRMEGVMRRPLPDLPWISAFPELNVRLYVERNGRPGVFFLSLDATNPLAVWAARRFFHLPYHRARMSIRPAVGPAVATDEVGFDYRSARLEGPRRPGFEAIYAPTSEPYEARSGTLEHWLTERYCLYARSPRGELSCTEVHHRPWPLQRARAEIVRNEMAEPFGLRLDGPPALLHFSRRLDVVVWSPYPVPA